MSFAVQSLPPPARRRQRPPARPFHVSCEFQPRAGGQPSLRLAGKDLVAAIPGDRRQWRRRSPDRAAEVRSRATVPRRALSSGPGIGRACTPPGADRRRSRSQAPGSTGPRSTPPATGERSSTVSSTRASRRCISRRSPAGSTFRPKVWRGRALDLIHEIEEEAAARRSRTGSQPLGVAAILGQHPHDRPKRPKKSPAPLFHACERQGARRALGGLSPGSSRPSGMPRRSSERETATRRFRPGASRRPCRSWADSFSSGPRGPQTLE